MAYQICPKTAQKNKDCELREEDDISKIVSNTEVESFDIKPEWLDDMSARLDTYNAKQKMAKYWWFLLLVPAIILTAVLIPLSINDTHLQTVNTNELIQNEAKDQSIQGMKTMTLPNEKSVEISEIQPRNSEKLSFDDKSEVSPMSNSKPVEKEQAVKSNGILKSTIARTVNSKTVKNTPPDLPIRPSSSTNPNASQVDNNQTELRVTNDDQSTKTKEIKAGPLLIKEIDNKNNQTTVTPNSDNFEQSDLVVNPEKLKLEDTDTILAENTITLPTTGETLAKETTADSSKAKEKIIEALPILKDSASIKTDNVDHLTDIEDKVEKEAKDDEGVKKDTPPEEEDIKIEPKETKDKLWTVGFTLGPDFLTKEITSNSDQLNFEQKNKEELFENTWGYNLELNRQITPWLTLGTGVGFKKYQEVNTYSPDTFITIDTTYVIKDISFMYIDSTISDSVLIPNFLTVPKINEDSVVDNSKQAANGTVTSSYVQLPINAQLFFINTKKFTAYTNLGVTVGLLTKNTGVVLDYNTNEIVNFTTRKTIYSSSIGLGINYNLFGPVDFNLYGAYQLNLTNFSLAPDINKSYNGFNLRTGLVFHF